MRVITSITEDLIVNNFDNDFNAMILHKTREQELLAQAENQRKAKSLREEITYRIRRGIRINNNPAK